MIGQKKNRAQVNHNIPLGPGPYKSNENNKELAKGRN
jgi:hypothetical protein